MATKQRYVANVPVLYSGVRFAIGDALALTDAEAVSLGNAVTLSSGTLPVMPADPLVPAMIPKGSTAISTVQGGDGRIARAKAGDKIVGRGRITPTYLSAIHKPLSDSLVQGGANVTLAAQAWSKRPFKGFRLWVPNYYDTDATISISRAAPVAVGGHNGAGLTWTAVTFGGAASGTVPAGKQNTAGSVGNQDVPNWLVSDPIAVTSIDRTDGGSGYLLQARICLTTAFSGPVISNNTVATALYNSTTGQDWQSGSGAGDSVSTNAAMTMAPMKWLIPVIEFLYDVPTIRVGVFGDSIHQGIGSAGDHHSAIMRACELLDSPTQYVVPAVYAIGGQQIQSSRNTLLNTLKTGQRPSIVCRSVWSPNNALSSDAVVDQIKGYIASEIAASRDLGIPYVIGTSGPVDNQTAAEYGRRYALNTWARGLYASGVVDGLADWGPLVEDPAQPGMRVAAYADSFSNSHYNTAGYGVIAQCWADALSTLI